MPVASAFAVSITPRSYQLATIDAIQRSECSGIICLPCGAGKTLVAIMIASYRGGHTLIFCNTNEVVDQFKQLLMRHTNLKPHQVHTLTASTRMSTWKRCGAPSVVITTYAMMAATSGRSASARVCMADIKRHNWRTIILDEVHCAAAVAASTCWRQLAADKIYGLTATLVRADNGVEALLQHVGPKVFEMGWRSLEADGFTAIVDPVVMFCNTPDDWQALDKHVDAMADVLNPVKVAACDAIRRRHHDERIIIFCDKLWACEILALRYTCPFLIGDTPDSERQEMLAAFREGVYTTIVLSRVGDTGWDIDASVAIVVDAHFGSERQEAQRIGRIMRPNANGMHSTFYDLVTNKDGCTRCFWHRHDYVRKLGYTFETRDATKLILEQRVSVDPQDLLAEISRHAAVLADRLSRTCDREKTSAERMQRYEDKANVRKAHPLFKKRARNRFQNRWGTAA